MLNLAVSWKAFLKSRFGRTRLSRWDILSCLLNHAAKVARLPDSKSDLARLERTVHSNPKSAGRREGGIVPAAPLLVETV